METVDEETQYWQMRIDQDDDDGAVAMPAPQPVPVRDAGEPTILEFSGAALCWREGALRAHHESADGTARVGVRCARDKYHE